MIKTIPCPNVIVQSPEGDVHFLNEYEWVYLRSQIKKNKDEGWTWVSHRLDHPVKIKNDGEPEVWPPQFELLDKLLSELYNGEPA